MNQTPIIVLVALALAAIVALAAGRVWAAAGRGSGLARLRSLLPSSPQWASRPAAAPRQHPTGGSSAMQSLLERGRAGMLVLALIGLLVVFLLLQGLGALRPGQTAPSGEFVVRIAPFSVEGGDARTGEIVAEQLRAELGSRAGQPVNFGLLRGAITSPEEAAEAARDSGA
ncbi:MAG TPA: hypothetical protein VLA19_13040, partial [Herpetosiphonaceae bacterium]|nr:hypothetical protein [Herpetosiphonaceae bacterium]